MGMTLRRKIEVLAEARRCSICLFEVLVGRGDHAHVHLDRPRRSRAARPRRSCSTRSTLACVFRLMSPISSRKIVPLVGLLELADLLLGGAGERALLVAEQLRLDQLVGNRRAVHLHEPLAGAAGCCDGSPAPPAPCRRRSRPRSAPWRWSAPRAATASSTPRSAGLSPTIWYRDSIARLAACGSRRAARRRRARCAR